MRATILVMVALVVLASLLAAPAAAQESSEHELFGGCTYLQCASICFQRHCLRCESGACHGSVQCLVGWCYCKDFECSAQYWDVIQDGDPDESANLKSTWASGGAVDPGWIAALASGSEECGT